MVPRIAVALNPKLTPIASGATIYSRANSSSSGDKPVVEINSNNITSTPPPAPDYIQIDRRPDRTAYSWKLPFRWKVALTSYLTSTLVIMLIVVALMCGPGLLRAFGLISTTSASRPFDDSDVYGLAFFLVAMISALAAIGLPSLYYERFRRRNNRAVVEISCEGIRIRRLSFGKEKQPQARALNDVMYSMAISGGLWWGRYALVLIHCPHAGSILAGHLASKADAKWLARVIEEEMDALKKTVR